mmetsp:Transcript_11564/g.38015  ORF Transcript_11564/g.38015 Transcript_11564/m.38015 type:complete len:513 (-) Transcript_11564:140-1678(-)
MELGVEGLRRLLLWVLVLGRRRGSLRRGRLLIGGLLRRGLALCHHLGSDPAPLRAAGGLLRVQVDDDVLLRRRRALLVVVVVALAFSRRSLLSPQRQRRRRLFESLVEVAFSLGKGSVSLLAAFGVVVVVVVVSEVGELALAVRLDCHDPDLQAVAPAKDDVLGSLLQVEETLPAVGRPQERAVPDDARHDSPRFLRAARLRLGGAGSAAAPLEDGCPGPLAFPGDVVDADADGAADLEGPVDLGPRQQALDETSHFDEVPEVSRTDHDRLRDGPNLGTLHFSAGVFFLFEPLVKTLFFFWVKAAAKPATPALATRTRFFLPVAPLPPVVFAPAPPSRRCCAPGRLPRPPSPQEAPPPGLDPPFRRLPRPPFAKAAPPKAPLFFPQSQSQEQEQERRRRSLRVVRLSRRRLERGRRRQYPPGPGRSRRGAGSRHGRGSSRRLLRRVARRGVPRRRRLRAAAGASPADRGRGPSVRPRPTRGRPSSGRRRRRRASRGPAAIAPESLLRRLLHC